MIHVRYSYDLNTEHVWYSNVLTCPVLAWPIYHIDHLKTGKKRALKRGPSKSLLFKPSVTQPISQATYDLNSKLLLCYSSKVLSN